MKRHNDVEGLLETALFRSRWILSPFYVGLCLSLLMLLYAFGVELFHSLSNLFTASVEQIILAVLSLIDLSLAANLVLIVIFSGYENFISKIDTGENEDRPAWMGKLDFSGLKMKLIGSIVAISAISLLRAFMELVAVGAQIDVTRIRWLVILHLTFIVSGVLFAVMDWVAAKADQH
ncbi:TIGR00645 family protein [Paraburkholderia sp. UYCP14C]|uniref:TIGR00645 family protein n=1 Tax=Paraburkholderia sp. UYCP14C TaxID=2511130 RepID=UPI00102114CD|nr:TIGR00645 family protein [Paraburkholderia sp. UYCP14C]RZF23588.1 TIGR00645 family protein [Paraburkholderia sp. UYCP14C]